MRRYGKLALWKCLWLMPSITESCLLGVNIISLIFAFLLLDIPRRRVTTHGPNVSRQTELQLLMKDASSLCTSEIGKLAVITGWAG